MSIKQEKNTIIKSIHTQDFLADAYFVESKEQLPLLIFAHGYKGYKDWGAWDLMAKKFAEAGFFFVKFNFSHNGTTLENPKTFGDLEAFGKNNFSKEMLDYQQVLSYFSQDNRVNPDQVAIMGHSRGGGISVIEAFEDDSVKALITLAGVINFSYRFPRDQRLEDWKNKGVMFSENKRTAQQMPHYYQFYEDFKENERRFTIQYAAQHLELPVLIIQGKKDEAVKENEAELLHKWCKNSELLFLENANHTFGAAEPWTESNMPEDLENATNAAVSFLKLHLQKQ